MPGVFKISVKPQPRYALPEPGEVIAEIPEAYQLADTSGLEVTFEKGENKFDVVLTNK